MTVSQRKQNWKKIKTERRREPAIVTILREMEGERCRNMRATALHSKRDDAHVTGERQNERETKTEREWGKVLSPASQTCVTNPQGPGARSVQDQSAAPQQGRSTLLQFPHIMSVCVCMCGVSPYCTCVNACVCVCVWPRSWNRSDWGLGGAAAGRRGGWRGKKWEQVRKEANRDR